MVVIFYRICLGLCVRLGLRRGFGQRVARAVVAAALVTPSAFVLPAVIPSAVVLSAVSGSAAAARAGVGGRRYVAGSVARLRAAPSPRAKVLTALRIAEPVDVLARRGGWAKVRVLVDGAGPQPLRGWVRRRLLAPTPPTLSALRAEAEQAERLSARRRAIERACALAPADETVIQSLIDVLEDTSDRRAHHMAKKGLIAAQKRNASWDGPLYPVIDRLTYVPRPCPAGTLPLADSRRQTLPNEELRARAFPLVDSGKVVSVTTRGYQTQLLDHPACVVGPCGAPQLAYRLHRTASSGALVPSWMVAGHQVTGYRAVSAEGVPNPLRQALSGEAPRATGEAGCTSCGCVPCRWYLDQSERSVVQQAGARWRLAVRTLDGVEVSPWQRGGHPYDEATPMARFDERPDTWRILWLAPSGREGCGADSAVWLVRVALDDASRVQRVEEGRRHFAGHVPGASSDALPGAAAVRTVP